MRSLALRLAICGKSHFPHTHTSRPRELTRNQSLPTLGTACPKKNPFVTDPPADGIVAGGWA